MRAPAAVAGPSRKASTGVPTAGRIVAERVVLPGLDDDDVTKDLRQLKIHVIDRVVVDLELGSRQVTTLGGTAFGGRLALCVGDISGSRNIDVILFGVQGGVAALDADDHCERARNVSQSVLDLKLSTSARSGIFQFEGETYLLYMRVDASFWKRNKVSVNVYRVRR